MTAPSLTPAGTTGQLQPLQELPLPAPVSYAPRTIGWVCVAILLAALLGWAAWRLQRSRARQRYRRDALAELAGIEAQLRDHAGHAGRAAALAAIPPLIKRTALAVVPREHVASLSGDQWLAFLQRTRGHFDARSGALLAFVSYAPPDEVAAVADDEAAALVGHARDWIEHHHVEV
jgi:Domain of unknown function (DUF4381)